MSLVFPNKCGQLPLVSADVGGVVVARLSLCVCVGGVSHSVGVALGRDLKARWGPKETY